MNASTDLTLDWLALTYRNYTLSEDQDLFWDGFVPDFPELNDLFKDLCIFEKLDENGNASKDLRKFLNFEFCMATSDNIFIRYDHDPDQVKGLNIQIPSHAISKFVSLFGNVSCSELFNILSERGCIPSRIDLAFDDYTKKFSPLQYDLWYNMTRLDYGIQIRTRFNKAGCVKDKKGGKGDTFYLGCRGANRFLRIYDKDKESDGEKDCTRYEFELHNKGALSVWNEIINHNEINFGYMLRSYLEIIVIGDHPKSQKFKWDLLPEWKEWVESQLYCTVEFPKLSETSTIHSKYNYYMYVLAPQVAKLRSLASPVFMRFFENSVLRYKVDYTDSTNFNRLNLYVKEKLKC